MINVTKTYLPPLEEYTKLLEKVWKSGWVTNNGQLVKELEENLKSYLKVKNLFLTSNGTIALQIAIKALELKKSIITTPFSYVATTNSILWENCKPVFTDIEPRTCCIDASLIEEKITDDTEAILATHVYGIPCDIEKIEQLAKKYKLKVLYDAAHAFGTIYKGKSIANYGDVTTFSFHATKLFHTIEGGAIVTNDDTLAEKINLMRSFGHIYDEYFLVGINGRNSELHAAMGLCLLPKVKDFIKWRKLLSSKYNEQLDDLDIKRPEIPTNTEYNYAYYPVLLKDEATTLRIKKSLESANIFPRRYFYPSLNTLDFIKGNPCQNSEDLAKRILCLPLYHELTLEDISKITLDIKKHYGA